MKKTYFIVLKEGKKKMYVPTINEALEILEKHYGLSEEHIFPTSYDVGQETVMSNGATVVVGDTIRYDNMIDRMAHFTKANRQELKRFYVNLLKEHSAEYSGFQLLAKLGRTEAVEILNSI